MFDNEIIEQLPEFQQVTYQPLDKNAPWAIATSWLIFFIILVVVLVTISFMKHLFDLQIAIYISIGLIAVMGFIFYYIFYSHKFRGYALREHDLIYKTGIFWHKRTILPFNRIQHLESHRGPLERKFGLATLRLYSAGGHGADLTIFGLESERASNIRQLLLDKIQSEQDMKDD